MDTSDFRPSQNVEDNRDEGLLSKVAGTLRNQTADVAQAYSDLINHPFEKSGASGLPPTTTDPLASQAGYNDIGHPKVDPLDFTNKYNTALSPFDEMRFKGWLNVQSAATGRDVSKDNYDYDMRGWWKANGGNAGDLQVGPGPSLTGAHLTDQFKKPNHPTFSDESQYSGVDGQQGGHWDVQPDKSYAFTPGASTPFSTPELQDYFKQVEPTNTLNLPPT